MKIKFFSHLLNIGKLLYLYGFGMWMTIITLNNIIDPETNAFYIKNMVEMNLFSVRESNIGQGLRWKATHQHTISGCFITSGEVRKPYPCQRDAVFLSLRILTYTKRTTANELAAAAGENVVGPVLSFGLKNSPEQHTTVSEQKT